MNIFVALILNLLLNTEPVSTLGYVRLRAEPHLEAETLAIIPRDTALSVAAQDDLWLEVDYADQTGWVSIEWIDTMDVADADFTYESTPHDATVIALDNVSIRSAPHPNSSRLGTVGWGTVLDTRLMDDSGLWVEVLHEGAIGWVMAEYLALFEDDPFIAVEDTIDIPNLEVASTIITFELRETDAGVIWYVDPMEPEVGHLWGTATPGSPGHIVLGGHSELATGQPGIFEALGNLQTDDSVVLTSNGVAREYVIVSSSTVAFDDVGVVYPTEHDQLTLMTCTAYSPSTQTYLERLLMIAEPVVG